MTVQVVSFHCVLKNKYGQVISSSFNQNVLTQSQNPQDRLKQLGVALQGVKKGEKRRIALSAEEAYGFYDPSLVLTKEIEQLDLDEPLKLGEQIMYVSKGKRGMYRVTEVSGESVTLDGNHPLAGQDLVFEIETLSAREATTEELAQAREGHSTPKPELANSSTESSKDEKNNYELGVA